MCKWNRNKTVTTWREITFLFLRVNTYDNFMFTLGIDIVGNHYLKVPRQKVFLDEINQYAHLWLKDFFFDYN